jgi:hypothetical protein
MVLSVVIVRSYDANLIGFGVAVMGEVCVRLLLEAGEGHGRGVEPLGLGYPSGFSSGEDRSLFTMPLIIP